MPDASTMFQYEYLKEHDILIGRLNVDALESKENAKAVYEYAVSELENQPQTDNFIMDVLKVKSVSSYTIGILMKSLQHMKKTKGYMVLLMTEELLRDIMLKHPEMFDYYAVFHTLEDAIAFIKK